MEQLPPGSIDETVAKRVKPPKKKLISGDSTSVASILVQSLVFGADAFGMDLRDALPDRSILTDPEGRLSYERYVALWREAEKRTTDPDFGLHFGEKLVSGGTYGLVGFIARHSRHMRAAMCSAARYTKIINETSDTQLIEDGPTAMFADGPGAPCGPWPRHKAEREIAGYVALIEAWTHQAWKLIRVDFQHAAPASMTEHQRIFDCEIRFGQPKNGMVFPVEYLSLPILGRDPKLADYLEQQGEKELRAANPPEKKLLEKVTQRLEGALGAELPTLEAMATTLGLSGRSLQRKLGEQGLTYSAVVDDMRHRTAVELLSDPANSIREIAAWLCFADAQAFRRAFRRWTGKTPGEFRNDAVAAP